MIFIIFNISYYIVLFKLKLIKNHIFKFHSEITKNNNISEAQIEPKRCCSQPQPMAHRKQFLFNII